MPNWRRARRSRSWCSMVRKPSAYDGCRRACCQPARMPCISCVLVCVGELDRVRSGYYPSLFYPKVQLLHAVLEDAAWCQTVMMYICIPALQQLRNAHHRLASSPKRSFLTLRLLTTSIISRVLVAVRACTVSLGCTPSHHACSCMLIQASGAVSQERCSDVIQVLYCACLCCFLSQHHICTLMLFYIILLGVLCLCFGLLFLFVHVAPAGAPA